MDSKELKAWQIVKTKLVDVFTDIYDSWSYEEYVDNFCHERENGWRKECELLTNEEYDLLCQMLNEGA